MSDHTFTIRANDQPWKPETNCCSRCNAPEDSEQRLLTKALWNEIEFRYCQKCAGE